MLLKRIKNLQALYSYRKRIERGKRQRRRTVGGESDRARGGETATTAGGGESDRVKGGDSDTGNERTE